MAGYHPYCGPKREEERHQKFCGTGPSFTLIDNAAFLEETNHRAGFRTLLSTGPPLINLTDVKVDSDGNHIVTDIGFVIDDAARVDLARSKNPGRLLKISPDGEVSVIARRPRARFRAVALHPDGSYIVVDMNNAVYRIAPDGSMKVIYRGTPLHQPAGVAVVP